MPKVTLTLQQIEDAIGLPVVVMVAMDATTGQPMQLLLSDLGAIAIANAVVWLNARLSTP